MSLDLSFTKNIGSLDAIRRNCEKYIAGPTPRRMCVDQIDTEHQVAKWYLNKPYLREQNESS